MSLYDTLASAPPPECHSWFTINDWHDIERFRIETRSTLAFIYRTLKKAGTMPYKNAKSFQSAYDQAKRKRYTE